VGHCGCPPKKLKSLPTLEETFVTLRATPRGGSARWDMNMQAAATSSDNDTDNDHNDDDEDKKDSKCNRLQSDYKGGHCTTTESETKKRH
jgi:hypothetical protein